MDKRKYLAKTLIAEYHNNTNAEQFRFTETAYRLKDGSIVIEYDGQGCSIYGIKIGFDKYIARKGIYSIDESDFSMWKRIRASEENGTFIDWDLEKQMQFDEIENAMFSQFNYEHENVLKLVGTDDLPF